MNVSSAMEASVPERRSIGDASRVLFFQRNWFPILWVFIGLVSAYDAYLVDCYQDCIVNLEENPLGRYLLRAGGGDVSMFMRFKAAGTLIVLTVMAGIFHRNKRLALPITTALATFQLALLLYMTCSVPVRYGDVLAIVVRGLDSECQEFEGP